jgi:hypothetical protein
MTYFLRVEGRHEYAERLRMMPPGPPTLYEAEVAKARAGLPSAPLWALREDRRRADERRKAERPISGGGLPSDAIASVNAFIVADRKWRALREAYWAKVRDAAADMPSQYACRWEPRRPQFACPEARP